MSIRARFAPSPTGQIHIGNVRVAIFNWLFARHEGGKFLLRIEDTDRERSTQEAVNAILDVLAWLGIDYDEPPLYQSGRLDAHRAVAEGLLRKGHAYKEDKGGTGKGECVIFKMPGEAIVFHDEIKGDLRKEAKDLPDFVIVRSDGTPTFHLANVADDVEMRVTHIIRGDDHVENTFRHVALYRAMGAEPPRYAHLPMIVNQQGKPYSKRDGDCFVGEFREKGFHPQALFNYLSLLGWSPGDDREKMTREDMVRLFTLDRVLSHAAQMDIRKLTHLNGLYLAEVPADEFRQAAREAVRRLPWGQALDEEYFTKVCWMMRSRTSVYSQTESWKYFFSDDLSFDDKEVRKALGKEGVPGVLTALRPKLAEAAFAAAAIEGAIHEAERTAGLPEGKANLAIRAAVTGSSRGAGLYETMELLGRERVLRRLESALQHLRELGSSAQPER